MIMVVYNALKPLNIPVAFLKRPQFGTNKMAISYHFFNESNANYGDGKANKQGGALQVDVFSKTDYISTVNEIKTLLGSANFMFSSGYDDIEKLSDSEQIYHKVLIFNYVESEVIK